MYGRGTQDMKSVCVQYLVSIQKLRRSGFIPKRSILLTFVPDEEIGGVDGMRVLLGSRAFADVHKQGIAIALDEGLATEGDSYPLFYGERLPWWVSVTGVGNTGHASRFIEGTAVEQILSFAQKALDYRQEQKRLLHGGADDHENCSHSVAAKRIRTDKLSLGDVTTLNITSLHASVMAGGEDVLNVVPPSATLKLDIRISPHTKPTDITDKLDQWCRECSSVPGLPAHGGLSWSIISKQALMEHQTTSLGVTPFDSEGTVSQNVPADDEKANEVRENQEWLSVIRETLQSKFNSDVTPMVFPAATDSRFLRALGIRAFGFSPIRRSPVLLHEHDEFIPIDVYLEGCEVYIQLIQAISTHP